LAASAEENGHKLWIRASTSKETKVLPVGNDGRFVDRTMAVIQSGLTYLAQPREATHPGQRMEVAAVASGSDGISLAKAYPLLGRSLRPVRCRAVEPGGTGVAGPIEESARSRVP
jgi:hypothetical protein